MNLFMQPEIWPNFEVFPNFENFSLMKAQLPNDLYSLEAKNAKKRTQIQLSHLGMVKMMLPELINLRDSGRHVIGAVL